MDGNGTNYWWEHVYCYKVTEIGLNGHMIGEVNQGESSLVFPHVHCWNWDSLVPKLSSAMGSAPWLVRSAFFPSSFPPSNLFSLCACLKGQHTKCFSCDFGSLLGTYLSAGCPIRCCERYTDDEATAPAPGVSLQLDDRCLYHSLKYWRNAQTLSKVWLGGPRVK